MSIVQKNIFKKAYKKLFDNQRPEVNQAIKEILANPEIGKEKKGDLAGVRVYKFQVQSQLYLLAYEFNSNTLVLLALGVHNEDIKSDSTKQNRLL